MAIQCHYFAAGTDGEAEAVLDWPGGPAETPGTAYEVVEMKGVLPKHDMTRLEGILTDTPFDQIAKSGQLIGERPDYAKAVMDVTDSLRDALAAATPEALEAVIDPWANVDDYHGYVDIDTVGEKLTALSTVARNAKKNGHRIYCWVCA